MVIRICRLLTRDMHAKSCRGVTQVESLHGNGNQGEAAIHQAGPNMMAAEIARAVFEDNHEALYKAFTKALLRGNAYCCKERADHGYGRLKEHVQHEIRPYQDASDEEIRKRIAELEPKLGYSTPEVLPPADEPKPN